MDGAELYIRCLEQATLVVKQVRPDQLVNDTPNAEWTVRDLLEHMLSELHWLPELVSGKTVKEVGDAFDEDFLEDTVIDLSVQWQVAADHAETAAGDADIEETAHLSYGDVPIEYYLRQAGIDLLIHAWDLAEAIGMPIKFNHDTLRAAQGYALENQEAMKASGLFAEAIELPETSTAQAKLLALFGRSEDWSA